MHGWFVQIPRRGLTENFNMAKINNLAIPWGGGGGGPDVPPPPPPPLDPPMGSDPPSQMVGRLETVPGDTSCCSTSHGPNGRVRDMI